MSFQKSLYLDAGFSGKPERLERPAPLRDDTGRLTVQMELLKSRLSVAVVYGGNKADEGAVINQSDNPRSWQSYKSVAEDIAHGLKRIGFKRVSVVPEDMRLVDRFRTEGLQFAWLNTGGVQGRNSMAHAASALEMAGIPYVGHDPLTAGILDNKHVFKRQVQALGLPTPRFVVSHARDDGFDPETDAEFHAVFGDSPGPFVVKPTNGRASLHVHIADDIYALPAAVAQVKKATRNHVLVEEYLPGPEYYIAVCGQVVSRQGVLSRNDSPFVFAASERLLDPDERIFTSKDVRPITGDRVRLLDPVRDGATIEELEALAATVYRDLNLETMVRLDVRADRDGNLSILEANPKPDIKAPSASQTSLICENLAAYDMTYDDLIQSLIADRIDILLNRANAPGQSALRALLQVI